MNLSNNDVRNNNSNNSESSSDQATSSPKKIVIAGAGVIGTSTAFYLAKNYSPHISKITIIDPTGTIAPAASGKAGGFLALDWNDHAPTGSLARRSFALHEELATSTDEWGLGSDNIMYRRLTCASISVGQSRAQRRPSGKKLEGVEWVNDRLVEEDNEELGIGVTGFRSLGDESTIAQVHPKMLCDAMWNKLQQNNVVESDLVKGKVVEAIFEENSDGEGETMTGARLEDGTVIDADIILFACGPWTKYGNCVLGVKYHSALIPSRPRVLNQSVFFDGFGDPEVYPRPDGNVYCTGFPDPAICVSEHPGQEEVRDEAIEKIVTAVRAASGGINGALGKEPELKQSCYLPTTPDGLPMMGEIQGKKGCYVAAGHGCWGILLGPGTGETMASLIATGKSTSFVNVSPFRPDRFNRMQL